MNNLLYEDFLNYKAEHNCRISMDYQNSKKTSEDTEKLRSEMMSDNFENFMAFLNTKPKGENTLLEEIYMIEKRIMQIERDMGC